MAIYECFDSFAAFECYLRDSGPELDPDARLLITEYCKYALSRAWFYYPDCLAARSPREEAAQWSDRNLSFPLEDLYADGQPAGQVGQEIYGAGAAGFLPGRAFHHIWGAPFRLRCNHFIFSVERNGEQSVALRLSGDARSEATFDLILLDKATLPDFTLKLASGPTIELSSTAENRGSFKCTGDAQLVLTWV